MPRRVVPKVKRKLFTSVSTSAKAVPPKRKARRRAQPEKKQPWSASLASHIARNSGEWDSVDKHDSASVIKKAASRDGLSSDGSTVKPPPSSVEDEDDSDVDEDDELTVAAYSSFDPTEQHIITDHADVVYCGKHYHRDLYSRKQLWNVRCLAEIYDITGTRVVDLINEDIAPKGSNKKALPELRWPRRTLQALRVLFRSCPRIGMFELSVELKSACQAIGAAKRREDEHISPQAVFDVEEKMRFRREQTPARDVTPE